MNPRFIDNNEKVSVEHFFIPGRRGREDIGASLSHFGGAAPWSENEVAELFQTVRRLDWSVEMEHRLIGRATCVLIASTVLNSMKPAENMQARKESLFIKSLQYPIGLVRDNFA